MPVITEAGHVRVAVNVGGEDVIFVCRRPSGKELSKFLSARFVTKRNKVQDRLYEARSEFVDSILLDVENVQFRDSAGQLLSLTKHTVLSETEAEFQSTQLGETVRSWKDLLPINWKSSVAMYFEDQQGGAADEGGN